MANRRSVRKRRERFFFEEFVSGVGLVAEIVEQREAPDMLVRASGRLIGVELTEFFVSPDSHGRALQAQESIGDQIATKAQRLYEQSGAPPAHVTLCFWPNRNLSDLNRDGTAKLLCEFVRGLNLATWQRAEWKPGFPNSVLPDEVSFVHALGVPSSDLARWGVARAGWVAPLKLESLQRIIDSKAQRIESYRTVIDEVWLLIIADSFRPSSLVRRGSDFDGSVIQSPFCRTYFFERPDTVIELGARNMPTLERA